MIEIHIKHFNELSLVELYNILKIRSAVFVVEQNCVYQDMDDKDQNAFHLILSVEQNIIGTTRLLTKGMSYENYCSIGRVAILENYRSNQYGKKIMQASVEFCTANFDAPIKISAQEYLKTFYTNLGFEQCGDSYLEDNIPHIPMIFKGQ